MTTKLTKPQERVLRAVWTGYCAAQPRVELLRDHGIPAKSLIKKGVLIRERSWNGDFYLSPSRLGRELAVDLWGYSPEDAAL